MTRVTKMTLMCAVAMAVVTAQSKAEVLLSNLTGSYGPGSILWASGSGPLKAAGFRMGVTSFWLDSVDLRLGMFQGSSSNVPVVSLFDNGVGDEPDNLLITLNNPVSDYEGADDTYAFTPATDFELEANTDYWIVVSNGSLELGDEFSWLLDNTGIYYGPAATSSTYLYQGDLGFGWEGSTYYNAYAVYGIIPEPATGVLLALGLAGLASGDRRRALRRRRSQKTHA